MKTMKTKLALVISAIVSINLVAGSIPAHAEEIQLRDMHNTEFCAPGVYLSYMDLSYTDFSGCDLTGAQVYVSDLTGSNFDGAILTSANFAQSNMAGSFVGAQLSGAYLNTASLSGNFERSNFKNASMEFTRLSGEFREANLSDAFIANAELSGSFVSANLSNAPAYLANLSGNFTNANFNSAILQGATLSGEFGDSSFYSASIRNATLGGSFARVNFGTVAYDSATAFTGNFPRASFRWVNLSGLNVSGNFDDADFTDALFASTHLQGSFQRSNFVRTSFPSAFLEGNFDGAFFTDQISDRFISATFTGSFVGATFSNTYFYVTNLSQADLSQSNFIAPINGYFGTDIFPKALPQGWTYCGLYGGNFFGPGQDLSNRTIGNGSFCDVSPVNWRGSNVSDSTFFGQSFIGSDLSELMFNNNGFTQVDFSGAKITRRLSGDNFNQVKFVNSDMTQSALDHSTMYGVDFSNANLENIDFSHSNLSQVDFSGANLAAVDFSGSTISGADFSGANLEGANFTGATLVDVRNLDCGQTELLLHVSELRNSEVHGCVFADIEQFRLSGSKFFGSSFSNVTFENPANYSSGEFYDSTLNNVTFISRNGGPLKFVGGALSHALFQVDSDFSNSSFEGTKLSDIQFKGRFYMTSFNNVDLANQVFPGNMMATHFVDCDLRGSNFTESTGTVSMTFENSNLAYANFSKLKLVSANFKNSNLNGTNVYRTSFESLITHNISGAPIGLNRRYLVRGGFIIGPTVQFIGENLSNFDFTGVDLRGAYFGQTNVSGANFGSVSSLFGVYGSELTGTPASLPAGVALLKGKIVGPGVYIESGDFRGVDFGSIDLSFAMFRGAHFEGSDLSRAKFRGTVACWTFADSFTSTPSGVYFSKNPFGGDVMLVGSGVRLCPANTNTWIDSPQWFIQGSDVSDQSFEGADLRNFAFRYGDFARANLRNANLSSAVLTGSDFSGADLRGANLTNADFAGAILDGALMTGITGAPAYLPDGWVYSNGSIVREGSQVSGMKLTNSRCAAGNESMAIDSQTHLTLVGDASYTSTLSMDTTQGFNAKGSCMVWFIDGAVVPSATKLTYVPGKSDIGKKVRVGVVRTDVSGTKTIQLSDELMVGKAKMNSAAPTVSGISKVGGRLTALRTTWTPGASYTYQWFRSGEAISGATKVSYSPSADDHQHGLSVKVCASKAYFETSCETSSASSPIAAGGFPKSPVVQLVVGKLTVGSILTGKPGNWLAGTSLSFQWLRDGVVIKDAKLTSYTLSSEDRGHVIQFQVTASKRGYIDQVKSSISKSIP